jgi:hypothetical protein
MTGPDELPLDILRRLPAEAVAEAVALVMAAAADDLAAGRDDAADSALRVASFLLEIRPDATSEATP